MEWVRLRRLHRLFLRLLAASALLESAWADGKVYHNDETVPPSIPFQRALILQEDGTETLFLQSRYQVASGGKKVGWIVPIPALPEVTSLSADLGSVVFEDLSLTTKPKIYDGSSLLLLLLLILAVAYVIAYPILLSLSLVTRTADRLRSKKLLAIAASIIPLLSLLILGSRGRFIDSAATVEVLQEHDVGIYHVKVIRAQQADDLLAWLQEHEFRSAQADQIAFADYIKK
ncbi:MAG: hypothetical protein AAGJ31_15165, partial [Verrucomicrobiota bacterium]